MNYEDILYDENNGVATITINRPDRYNAFRGLTCMELLDAPLVVKNVLAEVCALDQSGLGGIVD